MSIIFEFMIFSFFFFFASFSASFWLLLLQILLLLLFRLFHFSFSVFCRTLAHRFLTPRQKKKIERKKTGEQQQTTLERTLWKFNRYIRSERTTSHRDFGICVFNCSIRNEVAAVVQLRALTYSARYILFSYISTQNAAQERKRDKKPRAD